MTKEVSTVESPATIDLTALEFEVPCQYVNEFRPFGDCGQSNPAVWLVIKKQPRKCEHDYDMYMCESCWQQRGRTGFVRCPHGCFSHLPFMANVARLERIKP